MSAESGGIPIPRCVFCGRPKSWPKCDCEERQKDRDYLARRHQGMIRELEQAGYTVTPPTPELLRTIPDLDIKASS